MAMNSVSTSKGRLRATYIAIMIPIGVAINYIGGVVAGTLSLPIFMDSIGTIVVAAIMGPWVGAITGALFSVISATLNGNIPAALFAISSIGSGLIVGFMARYGFFKTWWHILIATVLAAIWNAGTGAPIAMVVYGGIDGNIGTSLLIASLQAIGQDLGSAAFWARIPINLVDKGIACVIAWIILKKLPENMKSLSGSKKEKESKESA